MDVVRMWEERGRMQRARSITYRIRENAGNLLVSIQKACEKF